LSFWKVAVCPSTFHVDGTQNVKLFAVTRRHAVLSADPGSHGRDADDGLDAVTDETEGSADPPATNKKRAAARCAREIIMGGEWEVVAGNASELHYAQTITSPPGERL
jgi:hypothetical protein